MIRLRQWQQITVETDLENLFYGSRYLAQFGEHRCFGVSFDHWEMGESFPPEEQFFKPE